VSSRTYGGRDSVDDTLGYSDGIASIQLHGGATADVYRGGSITRPSRFPMGEAA
jgi:hypothetical protein